MTFSLLYYLKVSEVHWHSVYVCVHVKSYLLLIELNWDQQQQQQQQKLKAENERSTQVAISIIKEQKWRRGGSEEGWKEMICSVNPNWITAITSLLSGFILYIFLISFQTSTLHVVVVVVTCTRDDMRHSLSSVGNSSSLAAQYNISSKNTKPLMNKQQSVGIYWTLFPSPSLSPPLC